MLQRDLNSQDFLRQFKCNYNKVASAMLVYEDLLKKIAQEKSIHSFLLVCQNMMIFKKP